MSFKFTCFGLISRLSKLEELLTFPVSVIGTPVVISFTACELFGNSLLKNSDFFSLLKAAKNVQSQINIIYYEQNNYCCFNFIIVGYVLLHLN